MVKILVTIGGKTFQVYNKALNSEVEKQAVQTIYSSLYFLSAPFTGFCSAQASKLYIWSMFQYRDHYVEQR